MAGAGSTVATPCWAICLRNPRRVGIAISCRDFRKLVGSCPRSTWLDFRPHFSRPIPCCTGQPVAAQEKQAKRTCQTSHTMMSKALSGGNQRGLQHEPESLGTPQLESELTPYWSGAQGPLVVAPSGQSKPNLVMREEKPLDPAHHDPSPNTPGQ